MYRRTVSRVCVPRRRIAFITIRFENGQCGFKCNWESIGPRWRSRRGLVSGPYLHRCPCDQWRIFAYGRRLCAKAHLHRYTCRCCKPHSTARSASRSDLFARTSTTVSSAKPWIRVSFKYDASVDTRYGMTGHRRLWPGFTYKCMFLYASTVNICVRNIMTVHDTYVLKFQFCLVRLKMNSNCIFLGFLDNCIRAAYSTIFIKTDEI